MNRMTELTHKEPRSSDKLPEPVESALQKVTKRNPLPLYHQLLQAMQSVLEENLLESGSFFATELLIQEFTGISRATIRKALEELVRQGQLIRITGRGTFVSVKIPEDHIMLPRLKSLTQDLIDRGMRPGTIVVLSSVIDPPPHVRSKLQTEGKVLMTHRIRTGNDVPILYLVSYIPLSIGLNPDEALPDSLYTLLERHSREVVSAVHTIRAVLIDEEIAGHLGVESKSAGFSMERTNYDANDIPVLYEEGIFRGDLFSYTIRMHNGTAT
ncbi:GntR family transcriptional regulator [Paenibacillus senegalensis]|uniref:GntR family transcriptional regulator n=1 Tax=Paenibacillus senegalensis TaxID=1465766 RepID=UPI000289163F|nr:GntR family transcriptional regulator [Paenibacillus senegalensis]